MPFLYNTRYPDPFQSSQPKPTMDEFAQSREDDDLFADEFEPVSELTIIEETKPSTRGNLSGSTTSGGTDSSTANNAANNKSPAGPRNGRSGGGREEKRGGRGANRGGGGLGASRYAPQADEGTPDMAKLDASTSTSTSKSASVPSKSSTATETQSATTLPQTAPSTATANVNSAIDSAIDSTQSPPSEPQQTQQPARPTAVRGDRHLTGGPAHKKLTEAELSEKMEKMKILNAQKAERFRLSEEDSAAYARKEKEMAKKRVEEQKNARAMDMERAKNRQRKLAAQGGREWDSEKQESDIVDGRGRGRSSEYVRGGHGGVIRGGLAGSRYAVADGEEGEGGGQSFRGRGGFDIRGRGNRGGRSGGRGGKPSPATVPTPDDFPELPSASKTSTGIAKVAEIVKLPIDKPAGDWAEEMATPVEDKKIDL